MHADWGSAPDGVLRVDGGMTASDWSMQFLSDIIGAPVDRPLVTETTALGVAYLAGMQAGICPAPDEFQKTWALERRFSPQMDPTMRATKYARWKRAVAATMSL
jgi:glycerol kinase